MSVNRVDVLYHEVHEGRGPHLLLVHGMLSSRAQWLPNLEALAQVSRPVVVELWGHGRSPAPADPARYHPDHYVEEFERLRRELGADRWLVCGQSLGAALSLRYTLTHPERAIAQVFTNSTSALAESDWGPMVRTAMEEHARRIEAEGRAALEESPVHPRRSRRLPPAVRDALVADCEKHDPRGIAQTGVFTVTDSSVRDRIHENRVRSLLVVGGRERRFIPHRAFATEHMPRLEILELEAGHAVNIEAAEGFNTAVTEFFGAAE